MEYQTKYQQVKILKTLLLCQWRTHFPQDYSFVQLKLFSFTEELDSSFSPTKFHSQCSLYSKNNCFLARDHTGFYGVGLLLIGGTALWNRVQDWCPLWDWTYYWCLKLCHSLDLLITPVEVSFFNRKLLWGGEVMFLLLLHSLLGCLLSAFDSKRGCDLLHGKIFHSP